MNRLKSRHLLAVTALGLAFSTLQMSWFFIKNDVVFYRLGLVLTILFSALWLLSISGRMFDLAIHRAWIIPYALVWGFSFSAAGKRHAREVAIAVLFAAAAQLPLILLPSRGKRGVPRSARGPRRARAR